MGTRMDLVVLTDLPEVTVVATSRLLKQRAVSAAVDADGLLRQAQAHTADQRGLMARLQEEARQQGRAEGLRQANEDMAHRLAAAQAARQVALQDLAPMLADIVVDAVAVLLRDAPRQALLGNALASVSGLLRQARWARLRVAPAAAESARAALSDARAGFHALDMVQVVPDESIDADGCLFETDVGFADASLGVQLAAIRHAVEGALAASGASP